MAERVFSPKRPIYLNACSTVGGKLEGEGPLGKKLDMVFSQGKDQEKTWEQAEAKMVNLAVQLLWKKTKLAPTDVDLILGGDLMNQCTATSFGLQEESLAFLGLYGACSTYAQGALLAGVALEAGWADRAAFLAASHYATAERQFRFPLEYGCQRPLYAQSTVTGCGAGLLSAVENRTGIRLIDGLAGRIRNGGVTDVSNMGAAMAPAAADTLTRYFSLTGTGPQDYDCIATGDLGAEGLSLLREMLQGEGYPALDSLTDCGLQIFDRESQDVHCGGSGCACSALVTGSLWMEKLRGGQIQNLLLVGTGALMSPMTVMQKQTIPAIAHLVHLRKENL